MVISLSSLTFQNISYALIFSEYAMDRLELTEKEFLFALGKLMPKLNIDELLALEDFFLKKGDEYTVGVDQWKNIKARCYEMYPEFEEKNFLDLPADLKRKIVLEWKSNEYGKQYYYFISLIALSNGKLSKSKIDTLFQIANYYHIPRELASDILRDTSSHNNEILRMLSNMGSKARVLSYLYTVRLMFENEHKLFEIEKNFLKSVKKSYKLEFMGTDFWKDYLAMKEGNPEFYKVKLGPDSFKRLVAVITILRFVNDDNIPENDKADFNLNTESVDSELPSLGFEREDIVKLGKERTMENFDKILHTLSNSELIILLIKLLKISWQDDEEFSQSEALCIKAVVSQIEAREEITENGDGAYAHFVSFLLRNPSYIKYRDGDDVRRLNDVLKRNMTLPRSLRLLVYAVEATLNTEGIEVTERDLKSVVEILTSDEEIINQIIDDCFEKNDSQAEKNHLLLSLMKVEYALENKITPATTQTIMKILDSLPAPESHEKNFVCYFMLRGMYTDKKLDKKELDFFDSIIKKTGANQAIIDTYKNYLYLESGVPFGEN